MRSPFVPHHRPCLYGSVVRPLTHHSFVLSLPAWLAFSFQLRLGPLDEPTLIYSQLSFQILRQSQENGAVSPDEVLEISYEDFSSMKEEPAFARSPN